MRAKKLLRTDPPRLTWRCTSRISRNGRRRVRGHLALAMSGLYRLQQNGERSHRDGGCRFESPDK